ncbi:hypothetical protein CDCA_CDCA11G3128 [Cyanidium caldarium]|uniref:Uncharacterized protein n=1 Tax=Cyanidium caldarium TaxID=2771 RepID=A0AAV9IXR6_CYACA|nr:hypothetical protein CDCA_CDCA11G3128 [Cyanidium caldarium]
MAPAGARDEELPLISRARRTEQSGEVATGSGRVGRNGSRWVRRGVLLGCVVVGIVVLIAAWNTEELVSDLGRRGGGTVKKQRNDTSAALMATVQAYMERQADPCSDFYRYACGGFLREHPVPPEEARWSTSDLMMRQSADALIAAVEQLRNASTDTLPPHQQRLVDLYTSCMGNDTATSMSEQPEAERQEAADNTSRTPDPSLSSVRPLLDALDRASRREQLFELLGTLHRTVADPQRNLPLPLFSLEVLPDAMQPSRMVLTLEQGGLGLPTRDYYISADYAEVLSQYGGHVARMLQLAGLNESEAQSAADFVVHFEARLANASAPDAELGDDARGVYNPVTRQQLQDIAGPAIAWDAYFRALLPDQHGAVAEPLVLQWPPFFQALGRQLAEVDQDALLGHLLRWHLLHSMAGALPPSSPLAQEHFRFYGQVVDGKQRMPPRQYQCIAALDANLGDDLGREYVARFFHADVKRDAERLIVDIERQFADILQRDDRAWLGRRSLDAALSKIRRVRNKVGYPDRWDDYGDVRIGRDDLAANVLACRTHNNDALLRQIGRARDPNRWDMTPATVNAYYDPLANEMNFPAGNFAPNFYSRHYPDAVNYGAVGNVIGHELGHGFDSGGRHYDADGRLREWMSPTAVQEYDRRAQCVVALYDGFEVEGLHVNGRLTLQENLADFAGLQTAYRAYRRRLRRDMSRAQRRREQQLARLVDERMTPEKLYFVAYAQTWCESDTPQYAKQGLTVDVHAPAAYRVNGVLSQFAPFGEAFGCARNAPMRPQNVCVIW